MTATSNPARAVARLAAAGLAAALIVAATGRLLERARYGPDDSAAVSRAHAELTEQFRRLADGLAMRATEIAAAQDLIRSASRDSSARRRLFDTLDALLPGDQNGAPVTGGLTVYDMSGVPLAWSGRVSDLPRERFASPPALFVAIGVVGPRLVRIEPVADPAHPSNRIATIVAEQLVNENAAVSPIPADTFTLPTSVVDVSVRTRLGPASTRSPYAFTIESADHRPLVEAEISPDSLAAARRRARAWTNAAVLGLITLTVLLATSPLLDWRRRAKHRAGFVAGTVGIVAALLFSRFLVRLAAADVSPPRWPSPIALLPDALLIAALVWLAVDVFERRRLLSPRPTLVFPTAAAIAPLAVAYAVSGGAAGFLLWAYERLLLSLAQHSSVDLLQFSMHPLDGERLGTAFALVLLHAGVIWAAALLMRLPAAFWRTTRDAAMRLAVIGATATGAGLTIVALVRMVAPVPAYGALLATAAAGAGAAVLSRARGPARRASQAARLGGLFTALLLPALALYPSLHAFAAEARERLVSDVFAPQAASQRDDLKERRLPHALEAVDAIQSLPDLVTSSDEDAAPTTDRAYLVWAQTELATYRMTSAVELYGPNGRLVSRFALNLPEYTTGTYVATNCDDWELYEEASPLGSSTRYVLRASRAICDGRRRVGAVVVRAMLDYRTLPFISPQSPYLESLAPERQREDTAGRDVEFVFYGWSRTPIYTSGTGVWPLTDEVFDRMVASREPLWASLTRDGTAFRVYFFNDRGGIYALGYPLATWLGHLVNLGELVALTAVLYVLLLAGATIFNALTSATPASGRALLREVRSSFYRKLFIAFVAAAVVPVVVLAFATRTYFKNQFRSGLEEAATKTATVAQRLIEDYASLQQRGTNVLGVLDDQFMVLVRRAIDQDVNLFNGPRLQATSERDLFASGILPSRTPGTVYRKIVLERLPTSIDVEEAGGAPHLLAAAPVRAGGLEGIVTVPQTLREQEIEQQIDELDRRVLSAAVLFVLLGAAIGYWMAERIADPVSRLTRATRRIARGDLDARIAATSSDELRRLVEDFNRMADDLKRQRRELERTQRLEAWADMARQVAHDIKNPLTPIQLSAEHARRVNLDRGRPLSPVLDECVNAILSQVSLLRQISAEFSSFASSPTPRPEPTDVAALVDEVVQPYRAGLSGRTTIDVHAEPDLPPATIDRTLFARALTNVIENALHAMPGGGTLTITASVQPAASAAAPSSGAGAARALVVQIADTGVGMDPEAAAKIFEPYFSTRATGTGLGLTIAKRNVELIGGSIAVASERGLGTIVTITLPLGPPT